MTIETLAQFTNALNTAQAAAAAYYDTDTELLADAEYDNLIAQIEIALTEHPEWKSDTTVAVLETVAAGASTGGDIKHPTPMLSLAKANTLDAVYDFINNLNDRVTVEPKLDGLAVRAVYTKGRLTQVSLRGDGQTGEDITGCVLIDGISRVLGLPTTHHATDLTFDVRGEVYMSDSDFEIANTIRTEAGEEPFKNRRNGAAGTLRKSGSTAPLTFAAYDTAGFDTHRTSHTDRMKYLNALTGIATALRLLNPPGKTPVTGAAAIQYLDTHRDTLGYPIDGAVIKADLDTDRDRLGVGNRHPKWAVAYKYAAEEATTTIKDIEVAIGKTGRLSLRIHVEPVLVGEAVVSFASGHNVGFMQREDLRIGDTVRIKRANDVIPYVSDPDLSQRPADSVAWIAPDNCFKCGEPFDKSTELWRCNTPECSVANKVIYACGRDALDIEGMSTSIVTALVESGRVTSLADLFTLTVDDLANLVLGTTSTGGVRRLGNANATKIAAEIEKAKSQPLNRVVCSLALRMTGRSVSRWLAAAYPTMDGLRGATVSDLANIERLGDIKAQAIHDGLIAMSDTIDAMAAAGVNMGQEPNETAEDAQGGAQPLTGMNVVVTGKVTGPLAGLSRNEMNELIEAKGGKASGSVSAKTSLLVCDPEGAGSSKHAKALALGVRIVTPEEFADLIG